MDEPDVKLYCFMLSDIPTIPIKEKTFLKDKEILKFKDKPGYLTLNDFFLFTWEEKNDISPSLYTFKVNEIRKISFIDDKILEL